MRSECYTYKFDSERGVFLFFSQICIKTKENVIKIDKNVLKFLKFVFFRFSVRKYKKRPLFRTILVYYFKFFFCFVTFMLATNSICVIFFQIDFVIKVQIDFVILHVYCISTKSIWKNST